MKQPIVFLFIILFLASCKREPEFKGLKFGVIAPLTGEATKNGKYIRDGVEKALSEINKDKELLKVYYEDACLGKEAVSAFYNLINLKKINAIAGNYCVIGLNAISDQLSKKKVITFQTSVLPESFKNNKYIFSTFSNMKREVEILTNLMIKDNQKKIGVIEFERPWSKEYLKNFKDEFNKKNIEILSHESYQIGSHDYKTQITKLKNKAINAIVVIHIGSGVNQIIKELNIQDFPVPIYGVQEAYDPKLFSKFNYRGKLTLILPFKPGKLNPLTIHAYNNTKLLYSTFKGCNLKEECILSNLEKKVSDNSFINYVIVDLEDGEMSFR